MITTPKPVRRTGELQPLTSGHRLRYATRQGRRPDTVVFVHGWPDSWRSFEPVMNALPSTIGAISVSLRGFGRSDARPDGYTPDDFAGRPRSGRTPRRHVGGVRRALDGLSRRPTGRHLTSRVGGRPRPHRRPQPAPERRLRRRVVGRRGPRRSDQRAVRPRVPARTLAAPVPAGFFDQLVAESLKAPARVWRAAFAGIQTMPPAHDARITAPTLLLWGNQRRSCPAQSKTTCSRPSRTAPRRLQRRRPQPELEATHTRRPRHRSIPPINRRPRQRLLSDPSTTAVTPRRRASHSCRP